MLFVCPSKVLHNFVFSWDLQWKQCLFKMLSGQTKSIMVFLILANSKAVCDKFYKHANEANFCTRKFEQVAIGLIFQL